MNPAPVKVLFQFQQPSGHLRISLLLTRETLAKLLDVSGQHPDLLASIETEVPSEKARICIETYEPGKTPAGALAYTKHLKDADWIVTHVSTL